MVVHLIDCYNVEVNGKILFSSVHYLTVWNSLPEIVISEDTTLSKEY